MASPFADQSSPVSTAAFAGVPHGTHSVSEEDEHEGAKLDDAFALSL